MNRTQFLVFEISPHCNLAQRHRLRCPVALSDRYGTLDTSRPITDDLIVESVEIAYRELGFRGRVAWHYYNEPMLSWKRLKPLMARISERVHEATFLLWTNGTLLPDDPRELAVFSQIVITNYDGLQLQPLADALPGVQLIEMTPSLDDRAFCRQAAGESRCMRMFTEIIIDHYGNAHLCCMDFRGQCRIGNIWDGFSKVALDWLEIREQVARQPMATSAPQVCRTCSHRMAHAARWVDLS